ncbi:TIGR03854 family LLM class F420-dependent oxidoreductase [soil metagenome]
MVKVRFGVSLGADTGPEQLGAVVDRLEAADVDSLWFSELVYSKAVDPFVGMAFALGRTRRLKVGTSVAVLPGGRHPILVAKQLASLAALGPKRVLPAFGLRSAIPAEREIFAVPDGQRAAVFDESLQLLRAALRGDDVDFAGNFFTVTGANVGSLAAPLDIWLGGSAPAAFRRIGRYGDGWLGSFLTPDEARRAREQIQAEAAEAGREIEPDHFGISLAVAEGGLSDEVAAAIRSRRPDADPTDLVAGDWSDLHRQLDGYIAAGLTKFVIRPAGASGVDQFLDRFIAELLPREN